MAHMGVSNIQWPESRPHNSRVLMITTPKRRVPSYRNSHMWILIKRSVLLKSLDNPKLIPTGQQLKQAWPSLELKSTQLYVVLAS